MSEEELELMRLAAQQGAFGAGGPMLGRGVEAAGAFAPQSDPELDRMRARVGNSAGANPMAEYMGHQQTGKYGDAAENAGMSLGAGLLAGAMAFPGPGAKIGREAFRWGAAPATAGMSGLKALEALGDLRDAGMYGRGRQMWENTGLPGRPREGDY